MTEYIFNGLKIIVELTNLIFCYTLIFQKEIYHSKKRIIITYICTFICGTLYTLCSQETWSIFITIVIPCIATAFIINWDKRKTILLSPCAYVLESAISIMCSYIVAMIANVPQLSLAYTNMPCILINSIFWVIASIICIYKKKRHIASTKLIFSKPIYIAITLGAISFLLTISAVQSIGNDYNVPYNQTNFLGFLWSTICIIFFILFIWLSRAISKKNELQREKDLINIHMLEQEKYIKLVIDKDIAMRKFKHDVKEHMNIIYSYINESSYEESKNYIKKMYDVFNDSQVIRYTGINAVDAIISDKKSYMDEHNITFNMNPSICEFPQRIEIFDICTVFINILTNAIEACEMLETNDRYIDLSVSIYDNKILICESNKYLYPILFDEKGNPISTKKDSQNHGLGSKNIRTVIEKYNGELQYHCEDGVFSIEIIL